MNIPEIIELQSSPSRGRRGLEAVILAGGLGTRLRSVVSDQPKCMARVAGKPFLHYVIEHLLSQQVDKFIFSLGYKSEMIIDYVKAQYPELETKFSIEEEPLGTGGAIKLACSLSTEKNILILNGDTLFNIDIHTLAAFHLNNDADCTIALKPMHDFDRYAVVELNSDNSIASFKEKQSYKNGLINGGVYALNISTFLQEDLPQVFSFEKDYLEKFYDKKKMFGVIQNGYFIDIGIPEDYEKAQTELKS